MVWVEKLIWGFCQMLADVMQLAGLLGLLGFSLIGLKAYAEWVTKGD